MAGASLHRRAQGWLRSALLDGLVLSARATRWRNARTATTQPFADLLPTLGGAESLTVRGRLVRRPAPLNIHTVTPVAEIGFEPVPRAQCDIVLYDPSGRRAAGPVRCASDGHGFFAAHLALDDPYPPDRLVARLLQGARPIPGTGQVRVLPRGGATEILVCDVDKTYLESTISGAADLLRLLVGTGAIRRPLPGMPELLRALHRDRALLFLTGTPFFFQQSLQARFEQDRIAPDGFLLRPLEPPAAARLGPREIRAYLAGLRCQFAFKLGSLVRLALATPPGSRFLLLGDDNQHDPAVYATFSALLAGDMDVAGAMAEAEQIGMLDEERATLPGLLARLTSRDRGQRVRFVGIRTVPGGRDLPLAPHLAPHITCRHRTTDQLAQAMKPER